MATDNSTTKYADIPELPGYRAGDDGTIWSCWTTKRIGYRKGTVGVMNPESWRQVAGHNRFRDGRPHHVVVTLRDRKYRHLHRLILLAFVGPCPPGLECRHLDGNPFNNRVENLSWGTPFENTADKFRHGTDPSGERNPAARLTENTVRDIRRRCSAGELQREISREFGVSKNTISDIVRRKSWKSVV